MSTSSEKQVETQGHIQKIAAGLEELTRQLNRYKPTSEGELGKARGEIEFEIAKRLSVTEQKVTQLTEGLEKKPKLLHTPLINFVISWWGLKIWERI